MHAVEHGEQRAVDGNSAEPIGPDARSLTSDPDQVLHLPRPYAIIAVTHTRSGRPFSHRLATSTEGGRSNKEYSVSTGDEARAGAACIKAFQCRW